MIWRLILCLFGFHPKNLTINLRISGERKCLRCKRILHERSGQNNIIN